MSILRSIKTAISKTPVVSPVVAAAITAPETRVMPFSEWSKIPQFFSQRDHERRATETSHIRRFKDVLPTHLVVAMVVYPDGRRFKVDGHTRTQAWLSGVAVAPESLVVLSYKVQNKEEAKAIYNSIDSRESSKTSADALFSAMRELKMKMKSSALAKGDYGYALNLAHGKNANTHFTKHMQVEALKKEIELFDSILPEKKWFKVSSIAAGFMSVKRDGEKALVFWKAVNEGGFETPCMSNAHEAARQFIEMSKAWAAGEGGKTGRQAAVGILLFIYDQWASNPNAEFDLDAALSSIDGASYMKFFRDSAVTTSKS